MNKRKYIFLVSLFVCAFLAETANAGFYPGNKSFKDIMIFNTLNTHISLNDALPSPAIPKNHNILVAQVCWVMDMGDCLGSLFG